jgi:AcrR family transcriptional regulator
VEGTVTVVSHVAAADRLFVAGGFHATTLDQIAADAGYTKGAVYSNFGSKEDLFFAVYERRADRIEAQLTELLADDVAAGLHRIAGDTTGRRGRDDGWLAVFFEFWAHVIRHPELRERFAEIHRRVQVPWPVPSSAWRPNAVWSCPTRRCRWPSPAARCRSAWRSSA